MSMNPQNQKPWKVEYAKSSRSSCRTCKSPIAKEKLLLGKMVQSSDFDGLMPMWSHADCIMQKAKQIKSLDDVGGIESLRWEDQQKITKYIEGSGVTGVPSKISTETQPMVYGVEVSKTSPIACKNCTEKIMEGEVRLSAKPEGKGSRGLAWHHANCFMELFPSVEVEKLSGWCDLSASEQYAIHSLAKGKAIAGSGPQNKLQESLGACKRKKAVDSDQNSKIAKTDLNVSARKGVSDRNTVEAGLDHSEGVELKSKLEAQTKDLWALKDDLKKHVGTADLRKMLEANDQDSTGGEFALRDCCADGMLFGALKKCPVCSGHLRYTNTGGVYYCRDYLSEWSECSYTTTQPVRVKGKWKIPEGTDNEYLCKWYKSQKTCKPVRILPYGKAKIDEDASTEALTTDPYFEFYGDLGSQQIMLEDGMRTGAYYSAITNNSRDFEGRVVVDVGAGSGMLSLFAAKAGAKCVYAVEASKITKYACVLIANNATLPEQIQIIEGKIEDVALKEKADILISEPMGFLLVNERMIESYIIARDRFLCENGKMFPSHGSICIAPLSDIRLHACISNKARFWDNKDFYTINLSSLYKSALEYYFSQPVLYNVDRRNLVSCSHSHAIDFTRIKKEELYKINIPFTFTVDREATVHGLACWFDVHFNDGNEKSTLTTAPEELTQYTTPEELTHWGQLVCLLEKPLHTKKGNIMKGQLQLDANEKRSYTIELTMSVLSEEGSADQTSMGKLELQNHLDMRGIDTNDDVQEEDLDLFLDDDTDEDDAHNED